MPSSEFFAAFRAALRRQGMPAAYASRCERELADHLEDLRAAAIANGMSEVEATQHAAQAIGDLNQLAGGLSEAMKQGTWWGRHPIIGFALLPVVCFIAALLAWISTVNNSPKWTGLCGSFVCSQTQR